MRNYEELPHIKQIEEISTPIKEFEYKYFYERGNTRFTFGIDVDPKINVGIQFGTYTELGNISLKELWKFLRGKYMTGTVHHDHKYISIHPDTKTVRGVNTDGIDIIEETHPRSFKNVDVLKGELEPGKLLAIAYRGNYPENGGQSMKLNYIHKHAEIEIDPLLSHHTGQRVTPLASKSDAIQKIEKYRGYTFYDFYYVDEEVMSYVI